VTAFVIVCAAMVAAALLWIIVPLLRGASDAEQRRERRISGLVIAIAVPALAVGMYALLSKWDWQAVEAQAANEAQMDQALAKLESRLTANPQDLKGWLLLGNSYMHVQRYGRAVDAFQRAYEVSHGQDVEAIVGLGQAMVLMDESTLAGRAGALFEAALAKEPNNPRALWFGGLAALQAGDLRRGRDRLQLLLAQNPPPEIRGMLERQVQDLNQQLGEAPAGAPPASATAGVAGEPGGAEQKHRTIRVAVTLSPQIRSQLSGPLPLFVLARDPAAGGPPLAVQRHSSSDLPLTVELSERDAMMPTRTIAGVGRVEVVARLSRSGTPQAQSGDFYGSAEHVFAGDGTSEATLNIIIDRTVP
jgi:cytochrome c-type biogenesis protein CcmH